MTSKLRGIRSKSHVKILFALAISMLVIARIWLSRVALIALQLPVGIYWVHDHISIGVGIFLPKLLIDLDLYSRTINRFIELSNTINLLIVTVYMQTHESPARAACMGALIAANCSNTTGHYYDHTHSPGTCPAGLCAREQRPL